MSASDEPGTPSATPQASSGGAAPPVQVGVPVGDLDAPAVAAPPSPASPPPRPVDLPQLPPVPDAVFESSPPSPDAQERWQGVIAGLEREAKALGHDPRAAGLYLEIGRIWEENLNKQRNAAMCYQRAFHLAPKSLPVLHASRRLFTEVGNWGMVAQIIQAEVEAIDDPAQRAHLLAEKGTLLQQKLKSDAEAQEAFLAAIELSPADPLAVESLESLYLLAQDHASLFRLYVGAADSTTVTERRVDLLRAAAQIAEDRLGDYPNAIALYAQVLALDPRHGGALAALRRLPAVTGQWELAAEALERSAPAAPAEDRTALLIETARIQQDRLGAMDKALITLMSGLEAASKDATLLREIDWIYQANARHDEVAKVLRFEIDATEDPAARAELMLTLAALHEDRLEQPAEAIAALEEALRVVPKHPGARARLARLYEKSGRWEPLAKLIGAELLDELDAEDRAARLFKLAEIYEAQLSRDADAMLALDDVVRLSPGSPAALRALERLYHKHARWTDLVALYEKELESVKDVEHRVFVWGQMADVLEHKLDALDRAAAIYEQISSARGGDLGAIRALQRVHTKRKSWPELIAALEREAAMTTDPREIACVLHTIGRVEEERLEDVERAAATYEKVLQGRPGYLPAADSLRALYERTAKWPALVAMHRRELVGAGTPERANQILHRVAEIVRDKIADDVQATQIYEQILASAPDDRAALDGLAEIFRRNGDAARLVTTLTRRAELTPDGDEKRQLIATVADLYEHKLADPERAADLRRGLPPRGAITEDLIRYHTEKKAWGPLTELLEAAAEAAKSPESKAQIWLRAAEVAEDALGDVERAERARSRAHELAPEVPEVLRAMERGAIARKDWPKAVELGERLTAYEQDPKQYAARQIRLGKLKETELSPPVSGAPHYLKALERVPDHPIALRSLEVAYRRAGAWDGVAALYQREALLSSDPERRASLFYRAGEVFENRLKRDDLAAPMYAAAHDAVSGSVPTIRAIARVAERRGDGKLALEMITLETKVASDPERTLQLLVSQGEIYQDKLNDLPRAIEAFQQVLSRAPQHTKAFHRLEAIYANQSAFPALVQLLVHRAQSIESPEEQAELYLGAARVAQDELKDTGRAVVLYREVLDRKPMHPKALQRIGPLLVTLEDWTGALDVFHKLVSVTQDAAVRNQGFRALGTIYEERREDLVKAVQAYQHAVQANPTDLDSLTRLARVYKSAQDWSSAANVLLRLVEVQPEPAQRIATLVELSQIYENGFNDLESAALALQKALEIDPSSISVILKLAELYERAGNWRMLGQVADQFTRALPPAERRRAIPLQLKMAEVYEARLGDDGRAATELRATLELEPQNVQALTMLARLYGKSASTFAQAIEVHRRLLRVDPFRVESYHELYRLFEARKEYDKAFVCAEILVFLRAARQAEDVFFQQNKGNVDSATDQVLSAEDHDRLVVHPEERGAVRVLLEILSLELSRAYPGDLAKYELNPRTDKHGPKSDLAVRKTADALAKVIGAPQFDLWVTKKFELSWFLENEEVPAIVMGAGLPRRTSEREMKFFLARQLERIKAGQQLWASKDGFKIPPLELEFLVLAAARIAKPDLKVDRDPVELDRMKQMLAKHISRRGKKALEELGPKLTSVRMDPERHRWASIHTANRAGLMLANEIEATIRAIARDAGIRLGFADASAARDALGQSPEIKELLCYAVSEEYFAARTKLRFSIQP